MIGSAGRERILSGVREALRERPRVPHPGAFAGPRPEAQARPVEAFTHAFRSAGGEVVHLPDEAAARSWLADLTGDAASVSVGAGVTGTLTAGLPAAPPEKADFGISVARGAVAETGSLILGSEDGRRTQLLPPSHVVLVDAGSVHATLRDALAHLQDDLPSGLGLHSGPSKSADIGQILVKGVHGPGRVVAVVVGP